MMRLLIVIAVLLVANAKLRAVDYENEFKTHVAKHSLGFETGTSLRPAFGSMPNGQYI